MDLPNTFQQLGHDKDIQEIYAKLGINGYFKLKPWGIDIKRAYEVMTTIDEIGMVTLTREDGQPQTLAINEYIVQDALHFKEGYEDMNTRLTDIEQNKVFLNIKGKQGTFDDMAIEEAKLPLQLFTQYFNLWKPQKFTRPNLHIAYSMSLATKDIPQAWPKVAKYILELLYGHAKSSNIKAEPCLYAGQMLTRIAYHLLGIID